MSKISKQADMTKSDGTGGESENFSLPEVKLSICLEELDSSDTMTRQSAIAQLHDFISDSRAVTALKKRRHIETSQECIADLDEILKLALTEKEPLKIDESQTGSPARIAQLWLTTPVAQLAGLFKHLKSISTEDQIMVFCEVLKNTGETARILPLLELSRRVLAADTSVAQLENLLSSNVSLLLIRVISLLIKLQPARLMNRLPQLLVHQNLQVRLMAIKGLHLLSKAQAIRLLNELISSGNRGRQYSAFTSLFVLPFEDTGDIVIRLIESPELPENLEHVIRYLVYNNPDLRFFKRITLSYLMHGKRIARLQSYWHLAARSLVVSGLTQKSEQVLKNEMLATARELIRTHLKQREEVKEENRLPVRTRNQKLASFAAAEQIDKSQTRQLLELCSQLSDSDEILSGIDLVNKHKLFSGEFCSWLESLLDSDSAQVVIPAIKTLEQAGQLRLLPHLPVLVFSQNIAVASASLETYAGIFPDKLAEKLKLWLRDKDSKIRAVAYQGLLKVDFQRAREIIMSLFKSSRNIELIKYYSPILLVNPDRSTAYKLSIIAESCSGELKKHFTLLAHEIQQVLGAPENEDQPASFINDAGLMQQWAVIHAKIRQISYENRQMELGDLFGSKGMNLALAGLLIIAALLFIGNFEIPSNLRQPAQVPVAPTTFSNDLGGMQADAPAETVSRPWDYQIPELATPPASLYQNQSLEEFAAVHEELARETTASSTQAAKKSPQIRLEEKFR